MHHLPLVILHGWSDNHKSFVSLAKQLTNAGVAEQIKHIHLGNYISMDDQINFYDLVDAMQLAWKTEKLPTAQRSCNMVVHSTGGLVVRNWLISHYKGQPSPIHHLLMLAPANFGSPLAHKGHSLLGRIFKGSKSKKPFQVGARLLEGLEMASKYTFDLADKDLFSNSTHFIPGKTLCTVLSGNQEYTDYRRIAGKDGSDGTVYPSTANLNAKRIYVDYAKDPTNPIINIQKTMSKTAFGIFREDHESITGTNDSYRDHDTFKWIKHALSVKDDQFEMFTKDLNVNTKKAFKKTNNSKDSPHRLNNTVIHLQNQYKQGISDYFMQFFENDIDTNSLFDFFHREAIRTVHPFGRDGSYRSIILDWTLLTQRINKTGENLEIQLYASPDISIHKNVGYKTFSSSGMSSIKLDSEKIRSFFQPNETLLIEMTIKRHQGDKVFTFHKI